MSPNGHPDASDPRGPRPDQDPINPDPPPPRPEISVTEAYAAAADSMAELRDQFEAVLRAAERAESEGRQIPLQLATWITGGVNPFLDFTEGGRSGGPPTRLDLLKRLGRQFAGTGAQVAADAYTLQGGG